MRVHPVLWFFSLAAVGLLVGCYNLTLKAGTGDGATDLVADAPYAPDTEGVCADDCVSSVTTLAAGAFCTVRVIVTPNASGTHSSTITLSATPGGRACMSLETLSLVA